MLYYKDFPHSHSVSLPYCSALCVVESTANKFIAQIRSSVPVRSVSARTVVRHQTIADHRQAMELDGLAHEIEINYALGIGGKDELPRIATLSNVVGNINRNKTS